MDKVIVFDLDGTLLDANNEIIGGTLTINLLNKLKENGFKFAICTGRLDHDIVKINEKYSLDIQERISQNGAVIYQDNHVSATLLDKHEAINIYDVLSDYNVRIEMNTISNRYWSSPRDPLFPKELFDSSIIDANYQDKILYQPVVLFLVVGDKESLLSIQEKILNKFKNVDAILTSNTSLEIVSLGVSKGHAIKEMYPDSLVYAIGDSQSDQSMAKYVSKFYYANPEGCLDGITVSNIAEALEKIIALQNIEW